MLPASGASLADANIMNCNRDLEALPPCEIKPVKRTVPSRYQFPPLVAGLITIGADTKLVLELPVWAAPKLMGKSPLKRATPGDKLSPLTRIDVGAFEIPVAEANIDEPGSVQTALADRGMPGLLIVAVVASPAAFQTVT